MPMETDPVVGAFYENAEGRSFEVTAFDENEATVTFRFADGSTEEVDLDAWFEMDLEEVSAPDELDEDEDDIGEEPAEEDDEDHLEEEEDDDDDYNQPDE